MATALRADSDSPPPPPEQLVAALTSDNVRMNAERASWALLDTNNPPLRLLEKALDSHDYQQRQFAANILRYHSKKEPSLRLLEVTIEGLRDDNLPNDENPVRSTCNFLFNAANGIRFLVRHIDIAKSLVMKGLDSEDQQQRFLCAYALGMNEITNRLKETVSILVFHLRDNEIPEDACMACAALFRLGPVTAPLLRSEKELDAQQVESIRLLLMDFESPPKTKHELAGRRSMQKISKLVYDPAIQYDAPACRWPFGRDKIHKALTIRIEQIPAGDSHPARCRDRTPKE